MEVWHAQGGSENEDNTERGGDQLLREVYQRHWVETEVTWLTRSEWIFEVICQFKEKSKRCINVYKYYSKNHSAIKVAKCSASWIQCWISHFV